jgi:hypothetical protein
MASSVADRPSERVLEPCCRFCRAPMKRVRPHQVYCKPSCRKADFDRRRGISTCVENLFSAVADAVAPGVFDN